MDYTEKETFNITVKCDSNIERDIVLDILTDHLAKHKYKSLYKSLIRFGAKNSNVFFSENDGKHFTNKERAVT